MYATSTRITAALAALFLGLGIFALTATPAEAKAKKAKRANAAFSWSAPSSTVKPGEAVTVTAKFGRKCRHRDVIFQDRREGGAWSTMYELNSDKYPEVGFNVASYQPSTTSYRVIVKRKKGCAQRVSPVRTYTVEDSEDTDSVEVE